MNYRPVIVFRELKTHEHKLMKNAESILKEIGFQFKARSPFQDDREWELVFSDDGAKEIYIQFIDDADEEHSPVIIIDNILEDKLQTIDGQPALVDEFEEIDEKDFENFKKQYFNDTHTVDPKNVEELLTDIFYGNDEEIFSKKILLKDLSDIKKDDDKVNKELEVIHSLLNYIADEDIMNSVYSIIE